MVRPKISSIILKLFPFLCLSLIALFSYKLLSSKFYAYPVQGDTYDEFKAPFNGISLWRQGIPESWSWYPDYGNFPTTYINGNLFRLVKPWFDEPALFSLMTGAYSLSRGITDYQQVDISLFRHPMVYLGVFNVILLFIIIYYSHSLILAIISSLIYASVPTFILAQRLPISDNMVSTFMLLSLLMLLLYLKKKKLIYLILLSLVAALSLHLKSTGIFIPVSVVAILWSYRQFKPGLLIILTTAISLILWFVYGYIYNWDLFLKIMSLSSGRELTSPTLIINLLNTFRIGEKTMGIDGWIIWGWFSVCFFSLLKISNKKLLSIRLIIFPLISYLIFFSIMSGHVKGWYRDPFYPLLAWASGIIILRIFKHPKIIPVFMFTFIPFVSSYIYGHGGINWSDSQTKIYQYFLVLLFTPFMLNTIFHHRWLNNFCRLIVIIIFILSIYFNYRSIIIFPDYFYYQSL